MLVHLEGTIIEVSEENIRQTRRAVFQLMLYWF